MERRSAERYYIDLPADACASAEPGATEKTSRVQIRDISSAGAAFYDGGGWKVGERVVMNIHVGDGIVGPFSYSLDAQGHIVRREFEESHGKSVFAVAFDEGIRMADWMEIKGRTNGRDKENSAKGGGEK
jgi:hypothetical protein